MIATTLLLTLAAAPAGGVVIFQGSPGAPGNVAVVDSAGLVPTQHPAGLQGIRLLGIDFNGRTRFQRLLPGRPRLVEDAGSSRLVLPASQGALYRFARAEGGGGTTFGLLWIDPAGDAHSVFELPGTGLTGDDEPFAARVAVAPAGDAVLVATTLAAGGDLWEVELASAVVTNRTAGFAPLVFGTAGLALTPGWGAVACADRLLRFDRALAGDAEEVSFGAAGTPAWFAGELVTSPSGLFAASIAGSDPTLADVWVFGPTGDAVRATETPMHLSGAGFEPEATHGPYLAVSDDGTRAAWRTEGLTREAYMAVVPQAGGPAPATHVSSDQLYLDTLDEIGEFVFRAVTNVLVLAVGEAPNLVPGIENLDFYEASLPSPGTTTLVNLTLSNGLAAPPFLAKSALNPEGCAMLPSGDVVFHDSNGGAGDLVSADPGQSGLQVHIPDVKALDVMELAGDQLFLVVRRSSGNKNREVWTLPSALTGAPSLVMAMPDTEDVQRIATRSDGWVGFVQVFPVPVKERLWLLDAQSGTLRKFRNFLYGPSLHWAPTGELAFSVGAAGTLAIQALLPVVGPPIRLKVPIAPGFVLPGAGF